MIENFLNMTWRNPLFMAVLIIGIWFLPGFIIREFKSKKIMKARELDQKKKISKLYPKEND
tara:strand:- start:1603 stop:1785 length:183 start_codon:yes stop_codon:yes gene_type:complete